MSDEQPVVLKKFKKDISADDYVDVRRCIIHYSNSCDKEVRFLSEQSFCTIRSALQKRQTQTNPSVRLDEICVNVPTQYDPITQGFHRWCYGNFTNVSRLRDNLPVAESCASGLSVTRTSGRSVLLPTSPLFLKQCLFCDKVRKTKRGIEEWLVKCVTEDAENNIKKCAREKQDFNMLGKVEGFNLRAREAMYHESCRTNYTHRNIKQVSVKAVDTNHEERAIDGKEQKAA